MLKRFAVAAAFRAYRQQPALAKQPLQREFAPQRATVSVRSFSADAFNFDKESEETLESLSDRFEDLLQAAEGMQDADVSLSNGVLNVHIPDFGTYVINKQGPNRQIWLSSPASGPARFDFSPAERKWIYRRSGKSLHELLDREIADALKTDQTGFQTCYLGGQEE